MATNNMEIKVGVEVTGAPQVDALGHSLDSTGKAAIGMGASGVQTAAGINQANASAAGFTATSSKLRDGLESVSVQLARAKEEMLALVGVGVGLQGVKDLSALADSYKNLEARIKLTTGEGKAFDTAFAGVFEVAKRTNSAVEETGLLFTKLAEAGKGLGVSNGEALKLTETINQSIQLSGASAEASKASIVQLVQGLQSGVLRGDEFNSVMEQSPRLARALGDGLGVTTGELRKMAEEGKLTSATIVKALQSQSDAVASEFGKLPATVGRAMTNLTTSFTAYVGESDKAHGYTSKLAHVIDLLAGNLGTVANAMIHTGQTLGAMKLLSMAQDWLSASAAIKTAAEATALATTSTVANTVAKEMNTKATVANAAATAAAAGANAGMGAALTKATPAIAGNAAAWGELGKGLAGGATAAAGMAVKAEVAVAPVSLLGRAATATSSAFAVLSKAMLPLAAVDIVLNAKAYGTAIGEWAARLMGAKDRTEELTRADKLATVQAEEHAAAIKKQANALKEATERSFDLSKEASTLVTKFDEMRTKGDSAADAIAKIGKDFDLTSIPGIKNAASVLDKLAADGKLSATEFKTAWADALKGEDLAVFETKARTAFAGSAREAERLAQVAGATLQEAVRRTGLDFDVLAGGVGKASRSAINDTEAIISGLDRLKAQGIDTERALTASIGKGIDTADSQKAIEAVKLQIEGVRKALGDKVADGLLDQAKEKALELAAALAKAKPGIQDVAEAMKVLGLQSSESMKKAAKSASEAFDTIIQKGQQEGESYVAWQQRKSDAAKVMLERVIAANGGVATESDKAKAAMYGLEIQTDKTGKSIVKSMGDGKDATDKLTKSAELATGAYEALKNKAYEATSAIGKMRAAEAEALRKDGQFLAGGYAEDQAKWEDKIDAVNKRIDAQQKVNGATVTSAVKNSKYVYDQGKGAGLTEAQSLALADKYTYNDKPGGAWQSEVNTGAGEGWSVAVTNAINKLVRANAQAKASQEQEASAGLALATPATPVSSPVKTYTVNINLGGSSTAVNTSSEADAQALIRVLQQAKLSS